MSQFQSHFRRILGIQSRRQQSKTTNRHCVDNQYSIAPPPKKKEEMKYLY